jgi:glycosyltransferase involved in cell wall biosynthesis
MASECILHAKAEQSSQVPPYLVVGVNAWALRVNGGGARYVFEGLFEAMLRCENACRYVVFAHPNSVQLIYAILKRLGALHQVGTDRVQVEPVSHPIEVYQHRSRFNLFFSPFNNIEPRLLDRPNVAYLHDILEHFHPELFSQGELEARKQIYPDICHSADVLVTVSEFCRDSISKRFAVDPGKIEVVYNAPQSSLLEVTGVCPDVRLQDDGGNAKRFLFYPANFYLHKNHARLLRAFAQFVKRDRDILLVLVGHSIEGAFTLSLGTELKGRVLHLTEIPASGIRWLYKNSSGVILPSLFEGFGVPAIEAALCSCRLACANIPAFRELPIEGVYYFDPQDELSLVDAISYVVDLTSATARIASGKEQEFSWAFAAARVFDCFQKALSCYEGSRNSLRKVAVFLTGGVAQRDQMAVSLFSLARQGYSALNIALDQSYAGDVGVRRIVSEYFLGAVYIPADERSLTTWIQQSKSEFFSVLHCGNTWVSTTLSSMLSAVDRDAAGVYVGEVFEAEIGDPKSVRCCRLQKDAHGHLYHEGSVHAEMVWINCSGSYDYRPGSLISTASVRSMLRTAVANGEVAVVRRTVAEVRVNRKLRSWVANVI